MPESDEGTVSEAPGANTDELQMLEMRVLRQWHERQQHGDPYTLF